MNAVHMLNERMKQILSLEMLNSVLTRKSNARPSRPGRPGRVKFPTLRSKNPVKCPGMLGGNGGFWHIQGLCIIPRHWAHLIWSLNSTSLGCIFHTDSKKSDFIRK